jgi:hypothetical protein
MNKAFVILMFVFYSSIFNACNKHSEDEITELKIVYVNADIETFVAISCDEFNSAFSKSEFLEKNITNRKQLQNFSNTLNNFQKDSHISSIDTRAKLYVTYADRKQSVLCVDRFGYTVMNDNYVGISKKIISFIKSNCKGFE